MLFQNKFLTITLILVVIIGIQFMTSKSAANTKYEDTIEEIIDLIEDEMDDEEIVGLSAALVDETGIIWSKGFGYADRQKKKLATADTVYPVGSSSEIVTSPALLKLFQEKNLSINSKIKDILPEFAIRRKTKDFKPITIKSLITHHGGIQSDLLKGNESFSEITDDNLLQDIKTQYICYPPDYLFSFSNVGLNLLSKIVEQKSGKDFNEYVNEAIFKPLGMKNSSFNLTKNIKANLSKSYHNENRDEMPLLYTRDKAANGLYTSVKDLSLYMLAYLNNGKLNGKQIFSSEFINEALTPLNNGNPLDFDIKMGYGWVLNCMGENLKYAGKIAWHDFSKWGFSGRIIMSLEHKIGIVVIANTAGANRSVTKIAVEGLKEALEETKNLEQPDWEEPNFNKNFPSSKLDQVAGDYATSIGLVSITRDDEDLNAELMGRELLLKPNTKGRFLGRFMLFGFIRIKAGPLGNLEFLFDKIAGKNVAVLYRYGDGFLVGEKINQKGVSAAWKKKLGEYRLINNQEYNLMFDTIQLSNENGYLVMNMYDKKNTDRMRRYILKTENDKMAVIAGLGRWMGETIEFSNDKEFEYSGLIFKR